MKLLVILIALGASCVSFGAVRNPTPADGALSIPPEYLTLGWETSTGGTLTVYLGMDQDDMNSIGNTEPIDSYYDPETRTTWYRYEYMVESGILEYGTQYYWKADGGEVWTFVTEYSEPIIIGQSDITLDGEVTISDFAKLAEHWLESNCSESNNWCQRADIDMSSEVDTYDLVVFASNWLSKDSIGDHVFEIEMSLSCDFGEGYGSSVPEDYQFDAWMQVDDTVVAGTLETPGGVVYPAELEVDDGENWLGVYAASDSLEDLSDFTDGEYIFTVTYANGISQSTAILFALEDGSPIPPVDQPLVVTYPVHNAINVPLTIHVEITPLTNPDWTYGIWCEPVYDDSALTGEIEGLPYDTTTAGPLELSPDTLYEIEITVNHAIWSTNDDGIPYVVDKDSEVEIIFTTGSE